MDKDLRFFTSESVAEGHPDKICDLIADSILDTALSQDPNSRIACEVCVATGLVMVMGEFTTEGYIDIPKIVRKTVKDVGYDNALYGFDGNTCAVVSSINEQSKDISAGVTNALEMRENASNDAEDRLGAGDQGMMFGYACDETPELMPLPIMLAHAVTRCLSQARKNKEIEYLRPDGKAQITVAYKDGVPLFVDTVVVSAQHNPDISSETIKKDIIEKVVRKAIPEKYLVKETRYFINPSGRFEIGGPAGDSGLTGRKIIVDTYGGMCAHGGGSFSGKDPTKVDRSACYYARYVCKNIIAAKIAKRCELQVAYAIGKANPVSIYINTFGTSKYSDEAIVAAVSKVFDFRPFSIIKNLGLRSPIYAKTTNYGHFGKEDLPWEKTDKADELKKILG